MRDGEADDFVDSVGFGYGEGVAFWEGDKEFEEEGFDRSACAIGVVGFAVEGEDSGRGCLFPNLEADFFGEEGEECEYFLHCYGVLE